MIEIFDMQREVRSKRYADVCMAEAIFLYTRFEPHSTFYDVYVLTSSYVSFTHVRGNNFIDHMYVTITPQ